MAHRVFVDSTGRKWDVWTVTPSRAERRRIPNEPWTGDERRHTGEYRILLNGQWASGWLAFETPGEKRRLAPYPNDWPDMTDGEMECLLSTAVAVRPSRGFVE
jgi:hypothetical protein